MMLKKVIFALCLTIFTGVQSQSFVGAWEAQTTNDQGEAVKNVVIFSDGYQVSTWYLAESGKFISCNGGSWKLNGNTMTETVEFDTKSPERVGLQISFEVTITKDKMGIVGNEMTWTRIDDGKPGALQGAWLMSGRIRDGKEQTRDTNRPRKTMKILSGTRFQWIAYNTETKQFMGTGGGRYTTENGKYSEKLEFFSRDDSKVGKNLEFDYALKKGNWHHSGFSSKGDPLHEIWSLRE